MFYMDGLYVWREKPTKILEINSHLLKLFKKKNLSVNLL